MCKATIDAVKSVRSLIVGWRVRLLLSIPIVLLFAAMCASWRRPGYWLGLGALAVSVMFGDAGEFHEADDVRMDRRRARR